MPPIKVYTSLDLQKQAINGIGYTTYDTTLANPAYAEGRSFYDNVEKALSYYNEVNGVTQNLGQEIWLRCKNTTGSLITNGSVVYISGTDTGTDLPLITKAQANNATASQAIAVLTQDIANNEIGYATRIGRVHQLDTSSLAAGAKIYLSATTAGVITGTQPSYPNYRVSIGTVIKSNATTGIIEISIGGQGLGSQIGVYQNQTFKQTPRIWTGTGTVAGGSGVATVNVTDDNLSSGNALFNNIYGVWVTGSFNNTTANNVVLGSHKATAANRKTVDVVCVDGLTAVLASPTLEFSPNGTVVSVLVIGD